MKCCDNCSKMLPDNFEEYCIGITKLQTDYGIYSKSILLCDDCLKSLKEELKQVIDSHSRFLKVKTDELNKME